MLSCLQLQDPENLKLVNIIPCSSSNISLNILESKKQSTSILLQYRLFCNQTLQVPVTKKEYGPITHIDFSPVEPHNFAVTNSTRVSILKLINSTRVSVLTVTLYKGKCFNSNKLQG
jgi:hypothetical protein